MKNNNRNEIKQSVINDIKIWINDNLDQNLKIEIVAKRAGYTNWHFQRMFKNANGVSLGSYIRKLKLFLSAKSLRTTNKKILDISIQYGYSSQQTFCRIFKKHFNETPTEYRKRISK
ncbi:helix-turn-helix domain-containing protein [Providencia rettgeri]